MKKKALQIVLIGMSIAALFVTGCGEVGPMAPTAVDGGVGENSGTPNWD